MLAEGTGPLCYVYTYILVNVTAACDRGCAASVGLLVANEVKRKAKRESKRGQQTKKYPVDGDTGNHKGDVGGKLVSYSSG